MRPARLALALSLCVVVAAHAASPAGALLAKLKSDLKSVAKTGKSLIVAERSVALAAMKANLELAKTSVLPAGSAIGGLLPVLDLQEAIGGRIDDTLVTFALRLSDAVADFQVQDPAATAVPIGLAFGDGGVGDATDAAFLRGLDALYGPVRKSMAAFTKALRAKSNVTLTLLVRPPEPRVDGYSASTLIGTYTPLTIDVIASASALDVAGDGMIVVSGRADTTFGNVEISFQGPSSGTMNVTPDANTGRWLAVYDDSTQGLDEASYVVRARQGTGHWVSWHIGVQ